MDFFSVFGGEGEEDAAVGGSHGVDGGGLVDHAAGDLLRAVARGFGTDGLECFGGFMGGEGADFGTGAGGIDMDEEALWGGAHEQIEGDGLGHGAAAGVAGTDKEDADLVCLRRRSCAAGIDPAGRHGWQHTGTEGLMLGMGVTIGSGDRGHVL